MEILIASHNDHKIKEIKAIFMNTKIKLISLKDLNDQDEVEETENTFIKNAIIKAKYYSKKYRMPALSDDSGLSVDALNGAPGVFSKRYSQGDDLDNNAKLIKALEGVKNRSAYFTSVVVIYFPDCTYKAYEGIAHGTISNELFIDKSAFGYDPIFYPLGYNKSYANIGSSIKNEISHRALALKKLKEDLHEIINHE
jgi:XTP/dITP diphosphohydrolase